MSPSRDKMINDMKASSTTVPAGQSLARILIRGCDPVMAQRASQFLPQALGLLSPDQLVSSTDDTTFVNLLQTEKFDCVFFAPGACRWSAAKKPIPGGNEETEGWDLEDYKKIVRELQGEDVPIVETVEERLIVHLLKAALKIE